MRPAKRRAMVLIGALAIMVGTTSCGGGGSSDSQTFATSKAVGQTAITMMFAFSPTLSQMLFSAAQTAKATSTGCANGGSFSVNPDGSITFYNCSLAPGLLFNGTIRIIPQAGDTQGGRIEFDNFSGTIDDETSFEMDGYIQETETSYGLEFDIDLDTTTTYLGEPSYFNVEGDIRIDDDGSMSGTMLMDLNDPSIPKTLCDFEGANAYDFIGSDGSTNGAGLMDQSCRELDTPFS